MCANQHLRPQLDPGCRCGLCIRRYRRLDGAGWIRSVGYQRRSYIQPVRDLIEANPEKGVIIVGHSDTSGGVEYNFELSLLRAENVYHLLLGHQSSWADLSESKHRIEDYQQILNSFGFPARSSVSQTNASRPVGGSGRAGAAGVRRPSAGTATSRISPSMI